MQLTGIIAALVLAIFGTGKDIVSKKLSNNLSGTLSAFASFLFALPYYLALLPILYLLGLETFTVSPLFYRYNASRALSDTGAEWSKMESMSHADVSLVSAFMSLSPAFLVIFSPMITGDPISTNSVIGLFIIAIAGILMANPFKKIEATQIRGILFGILSAFFFTINRCLDRLTAQTASSTLSACAMTALACLFISPFLIRQSLLSKGRKPVIAPLRQESKGLMLRGFFEVVSLVAMLTALQYLTAPTVFAISRLSVPLSIFCGAVIFKEKQMVRRLIYGTIMVIGSLLACL